MNPMLDAKSKTLFSVEPLSLPIEFVHYRNM